MLLSGLAAILGLARELLVLGRLGLRPENDTLQLALSIVYTVALFGEPLRLASLNLLTRRVGAKLAAGLVVLAAAVGVVTALAYSSDSRLPFAWAVAAGTGGAANLLLAWVLPRCLRRGPFLPVHAVSVLPNLVIIAGLLLPVSSDTAFAGRVVSLFLAAPILQLALLLLLSARGESPEGEPPSELGGVLRPIGWHAAAAVGGMATQFLIRSAALRLGPAGSLTAFVVGLRITETIRAVLVDTYIASRIRRWSEGHTGTSPLLDGRWLSAGSILAVVAAGLAVALFWPESAWSPGGLAGALRDPLSILTDPKTIVLLVGLYFVLALRVRYQEVNVAAQPMSLVAKIAGLEIGTAVAVAALGAIAGVPVALLVWAAYVAKPAGGLALVRARPIGIGELEPDS
ncbi:MAG: hypothetical protein ACRENB_09165 [Gemmatimonadales bacterium]